MLIPMPLFRVAERHACGFCVKTGLMSCCHVGGCWHQRGSIDDDHQPVRDLAARVNMIVVQVKIEASEYGLPEGDELS